MRLTIFGLTPLIFSLPLSSIIPELWSSVLAWSVILIGFSTCLIGTTYFTPSGRTSLIAAKLAMLVYDPLVIMRNRYFSHDFSKPVIVCSYLRAHAHRTTCPL